MDDEKEKGSENNEEEEEKEEREDEGKGAFSRDSWMLLGLKTDGITWASRLALSPRGWTGTLGCDRAG